MAGKMSVTVQFKGTTKTVQVDPNGFKVGSGPECEVRLDGPGVAPLVATVKRKGNHDLVTPESATEVKVMGHLVERGVEDRFDDEGFEVAGAQISVRY